MVEIDRLGRLLRDVMSDDAAAKWERLDGDVQEEYRQIALKLFGIVANATPSEPVRYPQF